MRTIVDRDPPPLRSLTQKQKWDVYKKMRVMLVRKVDYPVRFAIKVSILFFVLLALLPAHDQKLFISFASAWVFSFILG